MKDGAGEEEKRKREESVKRKNRWEMRGMTDKKESKDRRVRKADR